MTRTAINNAVEFGRHARFGGWALGLLVACSVEPDNGHGNRNDRSDSKISANEFARRAGTSRPRVLRYFDAWDRAAAKRIVPKAARLTPADVDNYELPEGYDWSDYYDAPATSHPSTAVGIIERQGASAVVERMTPQQQRTMLHALVVASDATARNKETTAGKTVSKPSLSDAWVMWGARLNGVMIDGAKLAERTETEAAELGGYAGAVFVLYQRFVERQIDAEIRALTETELGR